MNVNNTSVSQFMADDEIPAVSLRNLIWFPYYINILILNESVIATVELIYCDSEGVGSVFSIK